MWKAKAEEMEYINKKTHEEESKSGKSEFEGEKERVTVICEGACCDSHSGMNWEEEVVDLSWDESEHRCVVSGCVPAHVPNVNRSDLACGCGS